MKELLLIDDEDFETECFIQERYEDSLAYLLVELDLKAHAERTKSGKLKAKLQKEMLKELESIL